MLFAFGVDAKPVTVGVTDLPDPTTLYSCSPTGTTAGDVAFYASGGTTEACVPTSTMPHTVPVLWNQAPVATAGGSNTMLYVGAAVIAAYLLGGRR